jgi:hypothetical protein
MSWRLSCPRCGSGKVKTVHYASWWSLTSPKLVCECRCQVCDESCGQPDERVFRWPALDVTVGFAIIATATCALLVCVL